jgi:hypothetical protein
MTTPVPSTNHPDVLLVGAGIMIQVFERSFAEKLKARDGLAKLKEKLFLRTVNLLPRVLRCASQSMKNCSFCRYDAENLETKEKKYDDQ